MISSKILLISNGALCRNPRVLKEATALGRAGHDVTVLTVRNHAPSEIVDQDLLRAAPFRRVLVDELEPGLAAWRRRIRAGLARRMVARMGWQLPSALGPVRDLLACARRLPADLTIVHNEAPHLVGLRLLTEGRRVAADIEDWHSEDLLPADRQARPLRLLRATEQALLNRCAYTTTTSHALARALHDRYGGNEPHVITNSFPLQPSPRCDLPAAPPPVFFWFSQTLGPGRGLEAFLAAWAMMKRPSRVALLGEARSAYVSELLGGLPASRRPQVEFRPLVPPAELPAVIARHDIGLALEAALIVNRNLTITNKILQYLNAGLAVIASPTAGQREVLAHDPDAGRVVATEDPVAFAAALDEMVADPAALARRQAAARGLAKSLYCWEREEPRLLALVEKTLRSNPG